MSCPYAAPLTTAGDASTASTSSPASSSPPGGPVAAGSSTNEEVMEALALARSACPAFRGGTGCPFRDATDTEAMKRAMLSVPPSHIGIVRGTGGDGEKSGGDDNISGGSGDQGSSSATSATTTVDVSDKFRKALEHVHAVSVALHSPDRSSTTAEAAAAAKSGGGRFSPSFMLEGGCPFKTYYTNSSGGGGGESSSSAAGGGAADAPVPFVSAMEEFSLSAIIARMADEENQKREEEGTREEGQGPVLIDASVPSQQAQEQHPDTAPTEPPQEKGETHHADDAKPLSISAALQTGTAESHQAAESVHFVKNFVKGKIDRTLYAALVSDLYHVYQTLEGLLDVHGPTHFPALHHPNELGRTDSLEDDVEYFHGFGWEDMAECRPSPATVDYVERMTYIAKTEPLLLLSHAYTRYLGDLSGGRILARVARKALNLKGSKDGLRFYDFERIDSPKRFKDSYRRALDDLPLTPNQVDRLVAEANVAFVLNMRVFEELDVRGGVEGAVVRPLTEATRYYDLVVEEQAGRRPSVTRRGSQEGGSDEAKCPFAYLGGPNPHKKKGEEGDGVAGKGPPEGATSAEAATRSLQKMDGGVAAPPPSQHGEKEGRCPWPFVFFHDPATGMKDYQTWVVIGLFLCYIWSTARDDIVQGLATVWRTSFASITDGGGGMAPITVVVHLILLLGAYVLTKRILPRAS